MGPKHVIQKYEWIMDRAIKQSIESCHIMCNLLAFCLKLTLLFLWFFKLQFQIVGSQLCQNHHSHVFLKIYIYTFEHMLCDLCAKRYEISTDIQRAHSYFQWLHFDQHIINYANITYMWIILIGLCKRACSATLNK